MNTVILKVNLPHYHISINIFLMNWLKIDPCRKNSDFQITLRG